MKKEIFINESMGETRIAIQEDGQIVEVYIEPVTRPLILLFVAYMLTVLVPVLQFDLSISYYLIMGVNATVPLFVTIVFYKFVDVVTIYLKVLASHTETTLDDQLVPLVRRTHPSAHGGSDQESFGLPVGLRETR